MFFSEDLLSSKKGSFGIVWLAATLGPRTKRITRKQLISVDLTKTCELIAEPPEPMALRLSGCLLVGVARVYHQNYDLFYSDVTKFHSDLRRMVRAQFGSHIGPNGQPIGLDLAGDGKSKHDQITFAGEDVSWLTGIDLEVFKMDWRAPERSSRKRQHSTQLSSLASQQDKNSIRESQQDSDDDDDDDEEDSDDDEIESEAGRERKRKRITSSPLGRRKRNTRTTLPQSSQGGFNDVLPDIGDLFPEGIDIPSSDNGFPLPLPPRDLVEPNEPQVPDDGLMPDFPDQAYLPDDVILPAPSSPKQGGEEDREPSPGPKEDGQAGAKKPKKAKKVKKAHFDIDLEMEADEWRGRTYIPDMIRERGEQKAKERTKMAEERAIALLDGAGLWVDALDTDLQDMLATCARPGKFRWERDARHEQITQMVQPQQPQGDAPGFPDMPNDMGGNDFTNPDDTWGENWHDTEVPIHDVTGREPSQKPESETGRRASPGLVPESQALLPWSNALGDDFDDDFSVDALSSPMRLSTMTPLEKRLRSSGARGIVASRDRRERSASVPGNTTADARPLVSDEDARDIELPENPFATQDMPESQMRDDVPHAFQPNMLATLELQCRSFMYTERKMRRAEVDGIDFDQIIEVGLTKKVAALAFYNCLTLTTKNILAVSQPVPWEAITVRFTAAL